MRNNPKDVRFEELKKLLISHGYEANNTTKRINITVPIYALEQIDKYAKSLNINRSTFLVESALKRVGF